MAIGVTRQRLSQLNVESPIGGRRPGDSLGLCKTRSKRVKVVHLRPLVEETGSALGNLPTRGAHDET